MGAAGTKVRPTLLVKTRLVKATMADQFPEILGAISGITPLRNGRLDGRFVRANGFSTAIGLALPEKIVATKKKLATSETNHGRKVGK